MRHDDASVKRMEELLGAVSDPKSPQYGRYLTLDDLERLAPIKQESLDTVRNFILSVAPAALFEPNPNRDIVTVKLGAGEAENIFATKLSLFVHNSTGTALLRATEPYSVPAAVGAAIWLVGDLMSLPRISAPPLSLGDTVAAWPNSCSLSGCAGKVTPAVLKQRYSVPDSDSGMTAKNNSFAVAEFQGQTFKKTDLEAFAKGCNVSYSGDYVKTVIGGDTPASAGVESELDIEYIKGVSPGIDLTVIYSDKYSLLNFVTSLSKMTTPPLINSVSYGNDEKQQTSREYILSCNTQFMKAGLRGLSIMFASGDQGVCGREGCGIFTKRFKPDFPAGSPYITSVGGTDFLASDIGDEKAWSDSGGGFSDNFPIPSWQASAVSAYKASADAKLPPANLWNNTGRGYPDLAALGGQKNPYCVVINGVANGVAGTSASCPTAAAIFARLNGLRLASGKPALGFLNPFIYQNAAAFNDVTDGNNDCHCGLWSHYGFSAIKGWDPVTGMGTPNYAKLAQAVAKL